VAEGFGDIVLAAEAERARGAPVIERLLEYPLDGETRLVSGDTTRTVRLAAKADRIDLLEDGTFRVYDYKLSRAPNRNHVAQLPAYAAAARQRLEGQHGRSWRASDAAYISFGRGEHYEPLARGGEKLAQALTEGEARLVGAIDGIEKGTFPPAPAFDSTRNGWPSASWSLVPTSRARMSVVPPGGYGVMNLTGFVG
jgi:hypothetical protein